MHIVAAIGIRTVPYMSRYRASAMLTVPGLILRNILDCTCTCGRMASAERELITGVRKRSPQRLPGAKALVRGEGSGKFAFFCVLCNLSKP